MQIEHIKALIGPELIETEQVIRDNLRSDVAVIPQMGEHIINSGGKRLRPAISILIAKCFHPSLPYITDFGAIIEYIHTATLLHDDVIDNSMLRRGKKTANAIWDNTASVLVGDFLFTRSFQMMVKLDCIPIFELMANTTNAVSTGEVMQLSTRHNPNTTEAEYMKVVEYKTGILFAASAKGAGILAQADHQLVEALSTFGLQLGIAFQLIDDALDYEANQEKLGKTLGDDLAEGKATLPIIHAMQHANEPECQLLTQALMKGDRNRLHDVIAIIEKTGSLDYIYKKAEAYVEQAKQHLSQLPDCNYKQSLYEIADFSVARNF